MSFYYLNILDIDSGWYIRVCYAEIEVMQVTDSCQQQFTMKTVRTTTFVWTQQSTKVSHVTATVCSWCIQYRSSSWTFLWEPRSLRIYMPQHMCVLASYIYRQTWRWHVWRLVSADATDISMCVCVCVCVCVCLLFAHSMHLHLLPCMCVYFRILDLAVLSNLPSFWV